mmetsp:Transcript_38233/g.120391  ORF Transcript_38233/g.120391 Transcript_38233/m.120391 type:complete len:250 (-) Transcript_38233:1885-2634(-)
MELGEVVYRLVEFAHELPKLLARKLPGQPLHVHDVGEEDGDVGEPLRVDLDAIQDHLGDLRREGGRRVDALIGRVAAEGKAHRVNFVHHSAHEIWVGRQAVDRGDDGGEGWTSLRVLTPAVLNEIDHLLRDIRIVQLRSQHSGLHTLHDLVDVEVVVDVVVERVEDLVHGNGESVDISGCGRPSAIQQLRSIPEYSPHSLSLLRSGRSHPKVGNLRGQFGIHQDVGSFQILVDQGRVGQVDILHASRNA